MHPFWLSAAGPAAFLHGFHHDGDGHFGSGELIDGVGKGHHQVIVFSGVHNVAVLPCVRFEFIEHFADDASGGVISVWEHDFAALEPNTEAIHQGLLQSLVADARLAVVHNNSLGFKQGLEQALEAYILGCERRTVLLAPLSDHVCLSVGAEVVATPNVCDDEHTV